MKPAETTAIGEKITAQLVRSINDHLVNQEDFSTEEGEVKLIDKDESTIYFGLFEIDEETGRLANEPAIIWSIEVFADLNGGR